MMLGAGSATRSNKALLLTPNRLEGTSHSPSARGSLRTDGRRSRMPRRYRESEARGSLGLDRAPEVISHREARLC